ncbi:putative NADH-ubiquinone oxidoreductase 30.4 kDa subunit, mitochondrial [Malassezia pachydermatis]
MTSARRAVATRAFSTSLVSREKGDKVMMESPYVERANLNPMDALSAMQGPLHDYGSWIMSALPRYIQQFTVYKDELTFYVAPSGLIPTMTFLRDHTLTQYKALMDISGADYPTRSQRFEVAYHLLSVRNNARIRVKTYADELTPVPTVTGLFRSADWFEREAWDMFGIFFVGHPDLRRILTDYGFEGHPLRKDFPLTGYSEVRWDEEKKRVVQEPVQLMQAHRNFEANSTWEQVGDGVSYQPNEYKLTPPKPVEENKEKK